MQTQLALTPKRHQTPPKAGSKQNRPIWGQRMNTAIRTFIAIITCALATAPALGDTRDDVLAGVARCGVIHDDRVWLDCVYGAQQPMRARLGLSPCPRIAATAGARPLMSRRHRCHRRRAVSGSAPAQEDRVFSGRMLASTDMDAAPRMTAYRFVKERRLCRAPWRMARNTSRPISESRQGRQLEPPAINLPRRDQRSGVRRLQTCAPMTVRASSSVKPASTSRCWW